jgi:hypothetical protein
MGQVAAIEGAQEANRARRVKRAYRDQRGVVRALAAVAVAAKRSRWEQGEGVLAAARVTAQPPVQAVAEEMGDAQATVVAARAAQQARRMALRVS